MKLGTYIQQLKAVFEQSGIAYGHGTDNALDEAHYLVYTLLDIDFLQPRELSSRVLTEQELALLERTVSARISQRIPLAYLLGKAWFAGHLFYSDARALVPRSPIAELISNRFEPMLQAPPQTILDMCTGGGCIGIACALEFSDCRVDLVDLSAAALQLATENISLHGLAGRVATRQSDLFDRVQGQYDLIISNPPYVSKDEYAALPAEYLQEPEMALLSENEGLALPLQILHDAADYLQAGGLLILELGYSHKLLSARLPGVPLLWLDFEHGGEGVMAITAAELERFRERFN
jgi:ribosomal protein L3 glutamine methyltransferase